MYDPAGVRIKLGNYGPMPDIQVYDRTKGLWIRVIEVVTTDSPSTIAQKGIKVDNLYRPAALQLNPGARPPNVEVRVVPTEQVVGSRPVGGTRFIGGGLNAIWFVPIAVRAGRGYTMDDFIYESLSAYPEFSPYLGCPCLD
jgi:hypothetical protein